MSFQKKQRINHTDSRPKASKLVMREERVLALKAEDSVEARKALKKMNDKVYRGARSNLKEWYKPTGKGLTCNA
jgi:hypothetical protein